MERMRGVLAVFHRLAVPALYADFSSSRLLVMHDVAGGPISSAPEGPVRSDVAKQLLDAGMSPYVASVWTRWNREMFADMSASWWPLVIMSSACRCGKPGARILQRYGLLVPSDTR